MEIKIMEIKIIELKENNITKSAEIIRRSFKTVADEFGLTKENCPTNGAFIEDDRLLYEYNKQNISMFGLFKDTQQIGFVALEQKDGETFFLEKLAVLPDYRHNGYGKMLIDFTSEYVKNAGGKNISIGIIYENRRLLKWYETYGFALTETKQFEHLPFIVSFMRLDMG